MQLQQALETGGDRARRVLRDVFGYSSFRGRQEAIIDAALAGHDSLVLMLTFAIIWLPLGVVAMRRAQIVSWHDVGALMLGPALHAIGAVVVIRVSVMSGGV